MVLLIKWTGVKMGESVLGLVRPLLHYIKFPKIWIDNTVFRLHAKVNRFITKIWIDNTVFRLHAKIYRFLFQNFLLLKLPNLQNCLPPAHLWNSDEGKNRYYVVCTGCVLCIVHWMTFIKSCINFQHWNDFWSVATS